MKLRRGNIYTGVCQSFCSQVEVCLPQCMLGYTRPQGRYTPCGKHTPHPLAGTPPGRYNTSREAPRQRYPLGRYTPGRYTPSEAPPGSTPPPTVTAADGTHPPGMLSCYCYFGVKMYNIFVVQ